MAKWIIETQEQPTAYLLTLTSGAVVLQYHWGKQPPVGQTAETYLASCSREAALLADIELTYLTAANP